MPEAAKNNECEEIRINLKIKRGSHPKLFETLFQIDQQGRAEKVRSMATSYQDMLEGGAWVSQLTIAGGVGLTKFEEEPEKVDTSSRRSSLLLNGGLDKN